VNLIEIINQIKFHCTSVESDRKLYNVKGLLQLFIILRTSSSFNVRLFF